MSNLATRPAAPLAPAPDYATALRDAYHRALAAVSGADLPAVRRSFRRALRSLEGGDPRPAVLLVHRWAGG